MVRRTIAKSTEFSSGKSKEWLKWRTRVYKEGWSGGFNWDNRERTFYDAIPWVGRKSFEPSGHIKESVHKGPAKLYMSEHLHGGLTKWKNEAWEYTRDAVNDWNAFVDSWNPNRWPISGALQREAMFLWNRWNPETGLNHPFDSVSFRNGIAKELTPTIPPTSTVNTGGVEISPGSQFPTFGEMLLAADNVVRGKNYSLGLTSRALSVFNAPVTTGKKKTAAAASRTSSARQRILAWLNQRRKRS